MTRDEIDALSIDEVLALMRKEGLQVEFSLFASVHMRGPNRPNGFTSNDLDEIGEDLEDADLRRWRRELAEHFAKKG